MAVSIKYLLENSRVYDCYFIVGPDKVKIGVVKELVGKCSEPLQKMLIDSDIKEEGDVEMPDIEPVAVDILLRYAYGAGDIGTACNDLSDWDSTTALAVVKLADKYLIQELKQMALDCLIPSSVDNVFPALHCVVLYNAVCLESDVLKIIQEKTAEVFDHPNFVDINKESLLYILKQDTLNIKEVDLWKASLAWAKHRSRDEDKSNIRKHLLKPLQHIRLFQITNEEFWKEVQPSKIFTSEEIVQFSKALNSEQRFKSPALFSTKKSGRVCPPLTECLDLQCHNTNTCKEKSSLYRLDLNKGKSLKLKSLVCYGRTNATAAYNVTVTVTISQLIDSTATSSIKITKIINVKCGDDVIISPEEWNLCNVELIGGQQYQLSLEFTEALTAMSSVNNSSTSYCDGHDFTLGQLTCLQNTSYSEYPFHSHIKQLHFTYV